MNETNKENGKVKSSLLLKISAVYLLSVGLVMLYDPTILLFGTVFGALPPLVANLRMFAGVWLGLGALNWFAADSERSKALDAIVIGNIVAFGVTTLAGVAVLVEGATPLQTGYVLIQLVFAMAFGLVWRLGRAYEGDW